MARTRIVAGLTALAAVAASVAIASSAQAAGGLTTTFTKLSNPDGQGYQGTYTIANGTSAVISRWTVAFILPAGLSLGTFQDAVLQRSGAQVIASNRPENGRITPGSTRTFSFAVSGGNAGPTGCEVNGQPCQPAPSPSSPPAPTTQPPTTPPTTRPSATEPAPTSPPTTPAPTTDAPTTPPPAPVPTPTTSP